QSRLSADVGGARQPGSLRRSQTHLTGAHYETNIATTHMARRRGIPAPSHGASPREWLRWLALRLDGTMRRQDRARMSTVAEIERAIEELPLDLRWQVLEHTRRLLQAEIPESFRKAMEKSSAVR